MDVVEALRRRGLVDVDNSTLVRGMYSTDASLYRVVPQVVVRPRDTPEVLAVVDACRETGTPLTARGAGTSIAGNAVGPGVVMDVSRHLNRVGAIDVEARTAVVEPGVVHANLQKQLAGTGLRYGPDPSTHTRCTIGGMIGNNACGNRALGYGRAADNIAALDVVTISGDHLHLPDLFTKALQISALEALLRTNLETVRTEFGQFGRQVSGYSLEHLLPERFDPAAFLAGTEGTLAVTLGATVKLVADAAHRHLVVLGYPTMADAADAVPGLLPFQPVACEGLGSRIVDVYRAKHGGSSVPELPAGDGFLYVELAGDDAAELAATGQRVVAAAGALGHRHVTSASEQATLWTIREEGAGLASRVWDRPALSGWEDSAVPPERLGRYLRDLDSLLGEHQVHGVPFGHFGDGCVHIRIDFPLDAAGGHGAYRAFVEDAADLVAAHGGSLSGEHGDGRARSELLPRMYSPAAIALFAQVKGIFDPDNLLNPGVLVDPEPVDGSLRGQGLATDFGAAVHRCTGVGKCVAATASGVMCPSFQATRDEKDSTRGRARILQEMVDGRLVTGGWRAPEVHDALDLCLSCKGCLSDCPTGTDMATYKSHVLHEAYKGRLRPRSHYVLGRLPQIARLTAPVAGLANLAMRTPGIRAIAKWLAGVDQRRGLPPFAARTLRRWARGRGVGAGQRVVLWADSFTDNFVPAGGRAAVEVLQDAGYSVEVLQQNACCGLTWITTGQLDAARRILTGALDVLHPLVAAGVKVVGLEPSCLAALRQDAPELLDDPRAIEVAAGVFTLAEVLLATPDWQPVARSGSRVVVQPHCHHSAVLGFAADREVLSRTGADVVEVSGCCGLAGNFGVEKGHYEVSVAVAEQHLLPAVRAAGPDSVVVADGYSCRIQLDDLADVPARTLAQFLAGESA